jgi:hypothetical protein
VPDVKTGVTYYFGNLLGLLLNANVVFTSPILVTLMIGAMHFSETFHLTRATLRNIQEDGILRSHRRENLKPYISLTGWAL